jgi:ABC-type sugar transport system substrate-binding protein
MANVNLIIVNPTDADVTVNAQVAKARQATKLTIADTGSDAYGFLAAKCAVVSATAGKAEDFEKAGYLMNRLARFA